MSNVHAFRSPDADPLPMPETQTRRAIKASKAHIKRLQRQIRAEEHRLFLEHQARTLEDRLQGLRGPNASMYSDIENGESRTRY